MEHYYSNNPTSKSEERMLEYSIQDINIKFLSDNGVFSKNHVDFATSFLLNVLAKEKIAGSILDMGCGYGAIGITLAKIFSNLKVDMVDINERALELCRKNVKINNETGIEVIESDGFQKVSEVYDIIVMNPPIRAGKSVIYKMYEDSYKHLKDSGVLYIVINKKHGAPSTIEFLNTIFLKCEILDKKAGFNVIKSTK